MLSIVPYTQIHLFQQCQLTFNGYLKQMNSGSLTSILHILSSSWREMNMLQQLFPMRSLNLTCLYILTGLFMFFFFFLCKPSFLWGFASDWFHHLQSHDVSTTKAFPHTHPIPLSYFIDLHRFQTEQQQNITSSTTCALGVKTHHWIFPKADSK